MVLGVKTKYKQAIFNEFLCLILSQTESSFGPFPIFLYTYLHSHSCLIQPDLLAHRQVCWDASLLCC